jgi:hypothetical protein
MNFDLRWIDVNPNLVVGQQPVLMLERPLAHGEQVNGGVFNVAEVARVGTFWVPGNLHRKEVPWTVTRSGPHVRVPVYKYRTPQAYEALLFGMAVQLGMEAVERLKAECSAPIERVTLVLGHQVKCIEASYEAYLGIAITTKE